MSLLNKPEYKVLNDEECLRFYPRLGQENRTRNTQRTEQAAHNFTFYL